MNPNVSEQLVKLNDQIDSMRKKRESIVNSIRSNVNSFDDDVILCRCVAEFSEEIARLEFIVNRRCALNDCGLLDDVMQSEK